jgi:hypothetical protein
MTLTCPEKDPLAEKDPLPDFKGAELLTTGGGYRIKVRRTSE